MSFKTWSMILIVALIPATRFTFAAEEKAAEKSPFANIDAKYSYVIGVQIAHSLETQEVAKVDIDMVARALHDVLEGKPTLLSEAEITATFNEFRQKASEAARQKRDAESKANLEAGQKFLAENKTKEGVKVTASGLQYQVITEGTGKSPDPNDTVEANYRGTLIDGTVFDSSYDRGKPATFSLKRVIKGWQEGLPLMKEGAKYKFFIPANLAYGERPPSPQIPTNSTLIFEVELLKVMPKAAQAVRPAPQVRPNR